MVAGRKKGTFKTGGRMKGTPNKISRSLKADLIEAYEMAGGVDFLYQLALTDKRAFISLLCKILPTEATVDVNRDPIADILARINGHTKTLHRQES